MMTDAEVQAKIQLCITRALAAGYTLRTGDFGVRWSASRGWATPDDLPKCGCALGMVLLMDPEAAAVDDGAFAAAARVLQRPVEWVWGFVGGFDGRGVEGVVARTRSWALADELPFAESQATDGWTEGHRLHRLYFPAIRG